MLTETKTLATILWPGLATWLVVNATLISVVLGILTFIVILTFHILGHLLKKKQTNEYIEAEIDKRYKLETTTAKRESRKLKNIAKNHSKKE